MIEVREGNVVDALFNKEVDYIMHVVNCQGKMASGVAKEIRNRVPIAYTMYMNLYNFRKEHNKTSVGECSDGGKVLNLHAQEYYGYDNKRYLNYGALAKSLVSAYKQVYSSTGCSTDFMGSETIRKPVVIGIPFHMGSDRAGADWGIVCEILEALTLKDITIIAYKL
tara:strand:- start:12 stop:512 length:501 start_codon:yes stop_codon:yes gene_type:complete